MRVIETGFGNVRSWFLEGDERPFPLPEELMRAIPEGLAVVLRFGSLLEINGRKVVGVECIDQRYHDWIVVFLWESADGEKPYRIVWQDTAFSPAGCGGVCIVGTTPDGRIILEKKEVLRIEGVRVQGGLLLPRGYFDPTDSDQLAGGLREFGEEVRFSGAITTVQWLQLMGDRVDGVLVLRVENATPLTDAPVADGDEGISGVHFFTPKRLSDAIALGAIRDALSLAALAALGFPTLVTRANRVSS